MSLQASEDAREPHLCDRILKPSVKICRIFVLFTLFVLVIWPWRSCANRLGGGGTRIQPVVTKTMCCVQHTMWCLLDIFRLLEGRKVGVGEGSWLGNHNMTNVVLITLSHRPVPVWGRLLGSRLTHKRLYKEFLFVHSSTLTWARRAAACYCRLSVNETH